MKVTVSEHGGVVNDPAYWKNICLSFGKSLPKLNLSIRVLVFGLTTCGRDLIIGSRALLSCRPICMRTAITTMPSFLFCAADKLPYFWL